MSNGCHDHQEVKRISDCTRGVRNVFFIFVRISNSAQHYSFEYESNTAKWNNFQQLCFNAQRYKTTVP